jgi:hypothetical protein
LLVGFLRGLQFTPGGLALPFGRASVRVDVAEALGDREFLNFGGTFMGGAGFVMAVPVALMRPLVALMRTLGGLGGALDVFLGDGLAGGQVRAAALQLLGAPRGFLTR